VWRKRPCSHWTICYAPRRWIGVGAGQGGPGRSLWQLSDTVRVYCALPLPGAERGRDTRRKGPQNMPLRAVSAVGCLPCCVLRVSSVSAAYHGSSADPFTTPAPPPAGRALGWPLEA